MALKFFALSIAWTVSNIAVDDGVDGYGNLIGLRLFLFGHAVVESAADMQTQIVDG
jgi:hypothetical protein